MNFQLKCCYQKAWKGFSKAWIALCLISAAIVIFELIPRLIVRQDFQNLRQTSFDFAHAVIKNDRIAAEIMIPAIQSQLLDLAVRMGKWGLLGFPAAALLTILLLIQANRAVKSEKDRKRPFLKLVWITLVHILLAIIKCFAFFIFIIPGVILYVRLFFVSLLMLEKDLSAVQAVHESWNITKGHFRKIFLLILYNTLIQIAAMFTIIGLIPVNGFITTVRAAAFHMLDKIKLNSC